MFNYFDLFVVIVTLGLAIAGFREGILRAAIKLAGFIVTIILLALFSDHIIKAVLVTEKIPPKIMIPLFFVAIFAVAMIAFHYLANLIYKLVTITPVKFIDSGLGCIFGIFKALFLNGMLALLLSFASPGTFFHNQYTTSHTVKTLDKFLDVAVPMMKSAIIPIYRKYVPSPKEHEEKKDEKNIPGNII